MSTARGDEEAGVANVAADELREPLIAPAPVLSEAPRKNSATGLVLMGISAFFLSVVALLVKVGSALGLPAHQMVLARCVIQMLLAFAASAKLGISPIGPKAQMPWMFVRGACGAGGLAAFFYAVTLMDLGDATTVYFANPIFTAVLAHIFLGERITCIAGFAALSSLAGVILVARPEFIFQGAAPSLSPTELLGASLALLGAVMTSVGMVIARKFSTKVHYLVSVAWFGIVGSALAPWAMLSEGAVVPDMTQILVLIAIGIMAFLGQCTLNSGLQHAQAGPGTVMRNLDVVFSYIYQVFLLHSAASIFSIVGAGLIIFSAGLVAYAKWLKSKKQVAAAASS